MTDINFDAMSREELRAYVRTHPQDQTAFYTYMERLQNEPGIEITSMEQLDQVVEAKLNESDVKDAHAALEEAQRVGTTSFEQLKKQLGL